MISLSRIKERPGSATLLMVNALLALLVALMGFTAVAAFKESLRAIRYPFQLDYGEGIVLWQAQHVGHLDAAYTPVTEDRVVVFHYPPVYHYAARLGAILTGDLLSAGRAVSTLASIAIALLVLAQVLFAAPTARHWTSIGVAAVAGLLCYLSANQRLWSTVMRVDTLAVAFAFSGVFLFTLSWRYRSALWFASILLVLGIFTKQTMVTAPAACFLVALVMDRKKAFQLAAITAALGGITLLLLTYLTHGQFLTHTVQYNVNPFSLHRLLQRWRENLTGKAGITTVALVFATYLSTTLWRKSGISQIQLKKNEARFWLIASTWGVYFLLSLLMTLASGKHGSSFNYFIEWNAVCAVLGGLAFLLLLDESDLSKISFSLALALALPIVCVNESIVIYKTPLEWMRVVPGANQADLLANEEKVFDFIRQSKGPVFSDAMLLVLKSGRDIEGEPAIMTSLADAGVWDQTAFVAKIRSGHFDRVVAESFDRDVFTSEISKAIEETYPNVHKVGQYQLFEKP
jgi:hypothetical protein